MQHYQLAVNVPCQPTLIMMGGTPDDVDALKLQIQELEAELLVLKRQIFKTGVRDVSQIQSPGNPSISSATDAETPPKEPTAATKQDYNWRWPLEEDEYRRYGRQMIMPEIGLEGCPLDFEVEMKRDG